MKKSPMALALIGLGAVSSFADIKLNDNLTVAGFLDMSAYGDQPDVGDATLDASYDQLELDLMFKFSDAISARVDLSQGGVGGGPTLAVEQGFITASSGAASFSAGRFLSSSGFEAAEPTGMYQYSYSKTVFGYGGYQNGVNVGYSTPMFGLYGAVVTDLWNTADADLTTPGFEGQVSLMPMDGITVKVAYLYQVIDDSTTQEDQQFLNAWAMYAKGPVTIAGEYNMFIDWMADGENGNGWLGMINYKLTDKVAATVRYSGVKMDSGDMDTEITFSPSFAATANLFTLAEVRYDIDVKDLTYDVEATYSF
jgi:hypothetical protein